MGQMYNLSNAANLLGIKVRTARDWVHKGKLKALKYPSSNRWYVSEKEINRIKGVMSNDHEA